MPRVGVIIYMKMLYVGSVNMSVELQDIIISIDSREKSTKRIKAVEDWGTAHGAIIEHCKLDLCDYALLGEFKGHDINIGIEAKALSQFCSDDYALNKEKLFAACSVYDTVALFIEVEQYTFKSMGVFGDSTISIQVKKDLTIEGKLAIFEGACSTLGRYGIHVRQLRSEAHFPYAIENLLTYSIHDHELIGGIKDFKTQYKQTLLEFCTPLQTKKLMQHYPNMFWLCSAGEDAYKTILGNKVGKKLYDFIRNPELVTQEWSNQHFPDGTEIKERIYGDKDVIKAVTEYLQGFPEGRSADEICMHFDLMSGDGDKEKFLECLKKMAYKNIITNTVTGLFHIPKLQSSSTEQQQKQPDIEGINKGELDTSAETKALSQASPILNKSKLGTHDKSAGFSPQFIPAPLLSEENKISSISNVQGKDPKSLLSPPLTIGSPLSPAITHNEDEAIFGKTNPDWKPVDAEELKLRKRDNKDFEIRTANHKMSIRKQLEVFLEKPHTQQECVNKLSNFSRGAVSDHIFHMKREGVVVEFDDKTLVMKVK